MITYPNENATVDESRTKNDLYRRFKDYFLKATEKEFARFDHYGIDGYISVNSAVEEKVIDTLSHDIDEIVPITGATGIGKTYLLLYCLKNYYKVNAISTNHPMLLQKGDSFDLIYYSDFHITEPDLLRKASKLILAKIQAMYERLLAQFNVCKTDVDQYIQENKLEVKYYEKVDAVYQKELYKLTTLLSMDSVTVKNIVFIFDDLESLDEKQQFALTQHFLVLFENFKSKCNGKYCSKFLFCLRSNTFYNIYKKDFYNTHRASKAACLTNAPSLSKIFNKRFEIILNSDQVKQAKNLTSWTQARDILIRICNRIDDSYSNLLIRLNNDNVSNALEDFLNIVSNRRWTQKNVNPSASFVIDENHYYINDVNILRILCMGEKNVYFQTYRTSIRCILPKPGVDSKDDLICFLILRAFQYHYQPNIGDTAHLLSTFSANDLTDQLIDCLLTYGENFYDNRKNHIAKIVDKAFTYYEDNRFIKRNIDPDMPSKEVKYFMLPRGEQIFNLFFSQTILFTIFRDAFLMNDKVYDLRCSDKMSTTSLFYEALKYEQSLINLEIRLFNKITENKMWRNYTALFGAWSVSERFLNGINKSIQQVYKGDSIPNDLRTKLNDIKNHVEVLTSVFESEFEENTLF